jgi:uncharacterized protein (DUF2267 family)
MIKRRLASGAGALLLSFAAAPVAARQHPVPAAQSAGATESVELERKAIALLSEAIEQAQGLRLAENRVRVLASAAALLWPRNEAAGREMFARAMDGVRALLQAADATDPLAQERAQGLWQLRNEMLQTVAERDPRLALEFLRATRQPSFGRQSDGAPKMADRELALENELAARLAARDPREAARMIEEGLRRGLTPNLVGALQQLAQKDRETAMRLTAAAIARLRPEDLLAGYEATNFATQLLSLTTPPEPTPLPAAGNPTQLEELRGRSSRVVTDRIALDPASRRALVETLTTAVLSQTHDRFGVLHNIINALQPVLSEVERYTPGRGAALRRRVAEFERTQDPRTRLWREYQHLFQQGTDGAGLLEAAEKAPPELRDDLYRNAAWRFYAEDYDRALAAAGKVSDPQQRAQLIQEFERQRPWKAAEQGDFVQARQLINSLPTADQRAGALVALARSAAGRGLSREAIEALTEAQTQLGDRVQNGAQLSALLEVASAYAAIDPAEAFVIVESVIGQLNELLTAAAIVDGFTINSFREGELSPHGWQVWQDFIRRCAQTLAALARNDFDRASALARRFERTDARIIAQLHFVQVVLNTELPLQRGGPGAGPGRGVFTSTERGPHRR